MAKDSSLAHLMVLEDINVRLSYMVKPWSFIMNQSKKLIDEQLKNIKFEVSIEEM